jgi:hypothetical protein
MFLVRTDDSEEYIDSLFRVIDRDPLVHSKEVLHDGRRRDLLATESQLCLSSTVEIQLTSRCLQEALFSSIVRYILAVNQGDSD